jgi:hypothetical protein
VDWRLWAWELYPSSGDSWSVNYSRKFSLTPLLRLYQQFRIQFWLGFDSNIEVCILFVCRPITLRSSANFIIPLKIRYYIVGAVFDAEDVAKNNRKIFKNAVKDLRPETRARIVKILNAWNGRASEKELEEILGNQRANRLRELVDTSTGELTSNEVDSLRRLFKESVTFD